ncbi:sorting nexin-29 [Reticulomyxa filosa]|uniref:Sorting nexin-29 n=1 Tax=Reticulomyxa filosa TaxID=46433 RepID=X6M9Y2_RETFI|nr:sorting nexin-29 [Reticulomyxa filosa]|eukprot:ETO10441.1 sorting nexin-29 [Reticulomyxa filosa]
MSHLYVITCNKKLTLLKKVYELEVKSSVAGMPWLLYKRYTEFEELHQKLASSSEYRNKNFKMPQFPEKKVFGSTRRDVVEKRRQEFQTYLQHLLQQNILFEKPSLLMTFLGVPEALQEIIWTQIGPKPVNTHPLESKDKDSSANAMPSEVKHVYDLLRKLTVQNRNSYGAKALREFEKWYFSGFPRLHPDYIHRLFVGDPTVSPSASSSSMAASSGIDAAHDMNASQGVQPYKVGLISSCRFTGNNRVVSRNAMALLAKLLDIERNKDARNCMDIFLTLNPKYYAMMELHRHMQENSHEHSFMTAKLLYEFLPQLNINEYICDHSTISHFFKWCQLKQQSNSLGRKDYYTTIMQKYSNGNTEDREQPMGRQLGVSNVLTMTRRGSTGGLAPSMSEETNEWSYNCQDYSSYFKISESIEEQFDHLYKESTHNYQTLNGSVLGNSLSSQYGLTVFYKQGLSTVDGDAHETKANDNVAVSNLSSSFDTGDTSILLTENGNETTSPKKSSISDIFVPIQSPKSWKVRICVTLNHSAKDVYNFLVLGYVRNKDGVVQGWNRKVIDWKPLAKLDDQHIIYQETYKSFNSPYKFRHFVVLRYLKPNEEKGIYKVVFASVSNFESLIPEWDGKKQIEGNDQESEAYADAKELQNAYILPSGFYIEQSDKNRDQCRLEFIAHMTPESVLILAPDLLGETRELFESVAGIEQLVGVMKTNS